MMAYLKRLVFCIGLFKHVFNSSEYCLFMNYLLIQLTTLWQANYIITAFKLVILFKRNGLYVGLCHGLNTLRDHLGLGSLMHFIWYKLFYLRNVFSLFLYIHAFIIVIRCSTSKRGWGVGAPWFGSFKFNALQSMEEIKV